MKSSDPLAFSARFQFAWCVFTPADFHYEPHAHPYYELVLMQRGKLRSRVGGCEYVVCPGDIIVYKADTVHEEWVENGKPAFTWACAFYGKDLITDDVVYCQDTRHRIQELVAWLAYERHIHGPAAESGHVLVRMILTELKRLTAPDHDITIENVRDFIRRNLANTFTLQDLAAVAGVSRSYLARQYRAHTGKTPMEDARLMRVEEARRLLTTTKLPLHEIAPMVGIANEFHLSRLLKSVFGVGVRDLRPQDK